MRAKIPVTERALIQRINRKLAKNGSKLVAARGAKEMEAFGHYYTVRRVKSALNAQVLASHLDLVGYGRELGVLATDEEIGL